MFIYTYIYLFFLIFISIFIFIYLFIYLLKYLYVLRLETILFEDSIKLWNPLIQFIIIFLVIHFF